jgi:FkbM family methyltransferase
MYARYSYIAYRLLLRIKMGKSKRDEYLRSRRISIIDFLPEKCYSINGLKVIPRKGTYDFYMFYTPRELDVTPHLIFYENETFVDVGANVGSYSLRIAKDYNEKGVNVIAIEAHPDNHKALCRNIECNQLKNIKAINKAVSNCKGFVKMYERFHYGTRSGTDLYSIYDSFMDDHNIFRTDGGVIEVECDALDNILADNKKIDVMKIDIEGAEILALEGATNTLKQLRKIIVEVHGGNLEGVKRILESHSFNIQITNSAMIHLIGTK